MTALTVPAVVGTSECVGMDRVVHESGGGHQMTGAHRQQLRRLSPPPQSPASTRAPSGSGDGFRSASPIKNNSNNDHKTAWGGGSSTTMSSSANVKRQRGASVNAGNHGVHADDCDADNGSPADDASFASSILSSEPRYQCLRGGDSPIGSSIASPISRSPSPAWRDTLSVSGDEEEVKGNECLMNLSQASAEHDFWQEGEGDAIQAESTTAEGHAGGVEGTDRVRALMQVDGGGISPSGDSVGRYGFGLRVDLAGGSEDSWWALSDESV